MRPLENPRHLHGLLAFLADAAPILMRDGRLGLQKQFSRRTQQLRPVRLPQPPFSQTLIHVSHTVQLQFGQRQATASAPLLKAATRCRVCWMSSWSDVSRMHAVWSKFLSVILTPPLTRSRSRSRL